MASKYKDLVAIYLISNLTATKMNDCYKDVINLLRSAQRQV